MRRYYLLIGDKPSWEIAFKGKIWGFSQKSQGLWNTTDIGDLVAFYVTNPVKKIVGFGEITEKTITEDLIWPDEIRFNRSIWKYQIRFKIFYLIKDWNNGIEAPNNMMLNVGRKVISQDLFKSLAKDADSKWGADIFTTIFGW